MGSTLHGSDAERYHSDIYKERFSFKRKTNLRLKLARKITEAPIINDDALGQEFSFSVNGSSDSNVSYNLGMNNTTDEEVMPGNGRKIEQLKVHGSVNARIGTAVIDLKTYQSWGKQGFISNLYHLLEYKENRGWTNAPDHWDDSTSDGGTEYYKPGFSMNITQNLRPIGITA